MIEKKYLSKKQKRKIEKEIKRKMYGSWRKRLFKTREQKVEENQKIITAFENEEEFKKYINGIEKKNGKK